MNADFAKWPNDPANEIEQKVPCEVCGELMKAVAVGKEQICDKCF